MKPKMPYSPFTTRLSGSAKEMELRLRSIFQWKKKRPPIPLFILTAVLVLSCCGLVSCRVEPAEQADDPIVENTPSDEVPESNATAPWTGHPFSTEDFFASYVTDIPEYTYTGGKTAENNGHIFTMEDTPNNFAEAAVIDWYLLNWMDDTEKLGLVCGNELLKLASSSSYDRYTIHELSTLTPEEFTVENMPFLDSFFRWLNEDIQKFGLTEYTVVYVNHSWEWTPEHLALGPQLGNGRYEWLYLVGKTDADDAWKVYELYWGEGVFNRILDEAEPDYVTTVWQGEPIKFMDLSILPPESWANKVGYTVGDSWISFFHLGTRQVDERYQDAGTLYGVEFAAGYFYPLDYIFPWPSGVIAVTANGTYSYHLPSDVQFVPESEEEYTELFAQAEEVQFLLSDELKANSLNHDNPDNPDFISTTREGRTMVVTQDTLLTDCYSYTYSDPGDLSSYHWFTTGAEHTLTKGDIVLVLEEVDGKSRVVIPYGDVPWLYGFVDSGLLSGDKPDVFAAVGHVNQAIIAYEVASYYVPGGTGPSATLYPCRVEILEMQNGWAKVRSLGTGADSGWVDSSHLYYGFADDPIVDVPAGINLVN